MRHSLLLAVLIPVAWSLAGTSKPESSLPVTVRLHSEGRETDSPSFVTQIALTNPPKKVFIRQVPILTEKDFVAMYPFNATDGSIACYFKLGASGQNRLDQFVAEFRDNLAVILINGRVASAVTVSKPRDGVFYVPGGFAPVEITQLQTRLPVIGKEKEFDLQKKNAQMLLNEMGRKAEELNKARKKAERATEAAEQP